MSARGATRASALGSAIALGLCIEASCVPIGAFACTQDSECGPEGSCEDAGYCASIDEGCASGRRFSRYAPREIAERCVDEVDGASTGDEPPPTGTVTGGGASSQGDSGVSHGEPVRDTGESGDGADTASTAGDTGPASACVPAGRVPVQPILLYDFCEGQGTSVDSITDTKLELVFENGTIDDGFRWVEDGLLLDGDATDAHTALRSFEPTFGRLESCRDGGEVTLEVWATPLSDSQGGPTGIVTLGASSSSSLDLGLFMNPEWQVRGYVARLRTTDTNLRMDWFGTPYLQPNHLVLVHEVGITTLYLDGEIEVSEPHTGDLSGWNPNFDLVLGNLSYYDVRNWRGTFHLVAIYCEALDAAQVATNYVAGHRP